MRSGLSMPQQVPWCGSPRLPSAASFAWLTSAFDNARSWGYQIRILEYDRSVAMSVVSPTTHVRPPALDVNEVALLARVFAGVSDPTRLSILLLLLEHERNVSELVSLV